MWPETSEQVVPLKSGFTTGTCATACCMAAAQGLLANKFPTEVDVLLPRGKVISLPIKGYQSLSDGICLRASIVKDAGDDPDVTHGATIFVDLTLCPSSGVTFKPASGVGTVTLEGLVLPVGEPAINPVPRRMMETHLQHAAATYGYSGGFVVAVGVENGEAIALKTMNPKLGIIGGLSILGTTGIVRPYSCSAYIASIKQGIDVARANGITHIAATTGSTSEAAIKEHFGLSATALIEMGDFVGAVLKHLRQAPVARVSLCGGFGKLTKLACGHMDLNSRACAIDFQQLALWAKEAGAGETLQQTIGSANTSMQALAECQKNHIELAAIVCQKALIQARRVVRQVPLSALHLDVWAVDRQGHFVGFASEVVG